MRNMIDYFNKSAHINKLLRRRAHLCVLNIKIQKTQNLMEENLKSYFLMTLKVLDFGLLRLSGWTNHTVAHPNGLIYSRLRFSDCVDFTLVLLLLAASLYSVVVFYVPNKLSVELFFLILSHPDFLTLTSANNVPSS